MRASRDVPKRLASLLIFGATIFVFVAARAEGVLAKFSTGSDPEAIAFNAATATLFIVNKGGDSVTVLDRVHQTSATVAVGHLPVAIALDSERNLAYVVNSASNSVTRIDGATLATTLIAVGSAPNTIALDAETNVIFVVNNIDATITRIDGATLATTTAAVGANPVAVAVDPAAQMVVVVNQGSETVTMLDETLSTPRTYGTGHVPTAVAIDALHGTAYVINSGDTTLEKISTSASLQSEGTVALLGHPASITVAPSLNEFFVGFSDSDSVQLFDTSTGAFRLVQFGAPASALAFDAGSGKLYVATSANHAVSTLEHNGDSGQIIATADAPAALAIDALRHRAYCAESNMSDVLEIDGSDYSNTQPFGRIGLSFAVDPVANEIYATNFSSVVVIDGASLKVRTLSGVSAAAGALNSLAVNPVLHKLYVASGRATTAVINLDTGTSSAIATGSEPIAVAVNAVSGKVYVLDFGRQLFVFDSNEDLLATIPVGNNPYAVLADSATNRIFVSNEYDSTVTVVDGRTNTASTVTVSGFPINASPATLALLPKSHQLYIGSTNGLYTIDTISLAVTNTGIECSNTLLAANPLTEKIYCLQGNDVIVIHNGAVVAHIPFDNYPQAISVDPVLDKIYIAHYTSEDVEVIDGATNSYEFNYLGDILYALAINPITQQVFVGGNQYFYVVTPAPTAPNPLLTTIVPLSHNVAVAPDITLTLQANSSFGFALGYQAQHIYYQLDSKVADWMEANGGPGAGPYTAALTGLSSGIHVLFAYATDGSDATTTQTSVVSAPAPGAIAAYAFTVLPDDIFADAFD